MTYIQIQHLHPLGDAEYCRYIFNFYNKKIIQIKQMVTTN